MSPVKPVRQLANMGLEREVTILKWLIKTTEDVLKDKCLTSLTWESFAQNAELLSQSFHFNRPRKMMEHMDSFIATNAIKKE